MRGSNPIFSQDPPQYRYVGGKNGKKVCEKKGNNVGSCPFIPMTRQNLDLAMGKYEKNYLKSVKSK